MQVRHKKPGHDSMGKDVSIYSGWPRKSWVRELSRRVRTYLTVQMGPLGGLTSTKWKQVLVRLQVPAASSVRRYPFRDLGSTGRVSEACTA